jgi:hypothetical protein
VLALAPVRLSLSVNTDGECEAYWRRHPPTCAPLDFSPVALSDALDFAENAAAPRCNVLTRCWDLLALGVFGCVYLVLAVGVVIVAVGVGVVGRVKGVRA